MPLQHIYWIIKLGRRVPLALQVHTHTLEVVLQTGSLHRSRSVMQLKSIAIRVNTKRNTMQRTF